MNLIILGPQGSGKGTQAKLIAQKYNLTHISTGEWLRKEIDSGSDLGKNIKLIIENGELVSDDILFAILEKTPLKNGNGFILDGTPRNLAQAQAFDKIFTKTGLVLDKVINITLPRSESIKRMLHRAEIEGRADDNLVTINKRLAVFDEETLPVIDFYRSQGKVIDVDGQPNVDTIFADICLKLG